MDNKPSTSETRVQKLAERLYADFDDKLFIKQAQPIRISLATAVRKSLKLPALQVKEGMRYD